jgi:hypothetical protein
MYDPHQNAAKHELMRVVAAGAVLCNQLTLSCDYDQLFNRRGVQWSKDF